MKEPWFWHSDSITARVITTALQPIAALYQFGYRIRTHIARPKETEVPIVCIGNATLGGTGKTPFALTLQRALSLNGIETHFLTRGYGGSIREPVRVDLASHRASDVGDEAMLLAKQAPTWVGADRNTAVRMAAKSGARLAVMDDGLQNPTIKKAYSILLHDGSTARAHLFPAGRYREPPASARKRVNREVHVGQAGDARLIPTTQIPHERYIAFCGIGSPANFFATLHDAGHTVVETVSFPDHYPFHEKDMIALAARAKNQNAKLITTEKDFIRIPDKFHDVVTVLRIVMEIDEIDTIVADILKCIDVGDQK